jgi:predicted metal-dependent peptidase
MARKRDRTAQLDLATANFAEALQSLQNHPMFAPLLTHARVWRQVSGYADDPCPQDGWAVVTTNGVIHAHPKRRGSPEEWQYVLVHCLLHLGLGHFQLGRQPREWNAACDVFIGKFMADLKLGRPPDAPDGPADQPPGSEERLYAHFCQSGIPAGLWSLGVAGPHTDDMIWEPQTGRPIDWQRLFGQGLAMAAASAVSVAAGRQASLGAGNGQMTVARRAREWFINSYPLLGSLAAAFKIVEDPLICQRLHISVAAVDAESKDIFVNPAAGLDEQESRFVMAHELLHVGLRHQARCQGRDPFLWNVACDYVVNGWLVEMGLGDLPQFGVLHDPTLKGESAEAIYDLIVTDMRRYRKLATLRGVGLGDILGEEWWTRGSGVDLDDFYRSCLSQGLDYHLDGQRGSLPSGLVEEIRALSQPPIPWDVELARWFDRYFAPIETMRSYARPSRRQSTTPDIPRPRVVPIQGAQDGRTFGVVLDTSGSMDRKLLAKALGAIASYSMARDVPAARVVFCDAAAYDAGYMAPEAIADRVRVRGRGGTILQPGVDLLEKADDFPKDGPLLIITDGWCDRLRVRRDHAFLMPLGRFLPFVPRGPVFRIS